MANATKFYAVADINGPISVRINAQSASDARDWFASQDDNFGDDCRTDAEDDLGVCGAGMSRAEFTEVMSAKGYEVADDNLCGGHNWCLWGKRD